MHICYFFENNAYMLFVKRELGEKKMSGAVLKPDC